MSDQTEIVFEVAAQGEILAQYMQSRARVTFIRGPLGSGKTYASCMRVFDQMCEQAPNEHKVRKSRWVAVRNTYADLQSTTIKDWKDLYAEDDMPSLGRFVNDSPPTHYLDFDLDDGTRVRAELVFLALDRPDHIKKLRGLQATGFWLNEAKELPKSIVDMCDLRHGRYPSAKDGGPSWHGMIGDTNSPDDDHWYYKLAEESKPKDWLFLTQPGGLKRITEGGGAYRWVPNEKAENLHNLPDGYYLNGMQGKADDWIRVNLANEYGTVVTGKPIYGGTWNDAEHVAPYDLAAMPKVQKLLLGFDFGRTPACIIGQLMPSGKLRVIKEIVSEDMGIRTFMREHVFPCLLTEFQRFPLASIEAFGDPSGIAKSGNDENSPIGILNDEFNLVAYPTATNDPQRRWEAVEYFLKLKLDTEIAFELSPSCTVIRKGFNGGYHFRRLNVSGERYANKADKNSFSHPHDALQYLCLGAQGEVDYAWRDQHIEESQQSVVADPVAGY